MTKYIFVTGGVVSSLGKGIVAASLGRLLKNRGLEVTIQKFDPYINIDPGTMSLEEVKIYQKILRKSNFKAHIAPHTIEMAAMFAILSRLVPSAKVDSG